MSNCLISNVENILLTKIYNILLKNMLKNSRLGFDQYNQEARGIKLVCSKA